MQPVSGGGGGSSASGSGNSGGQPPPDPDWQLRRIRPGIILEVIAVQAGFDQVNQQTPVGSTVLLQQTLGDGTIVLFQFCIHRAAVARPGARA